LVRDEAARADALAAVRAFLETAGWAVQATTDSPIPGGDGNREYLLWAKKKPPAVKRTAQSMATPRS
jgi:23S rRNA (cytidine1920-2'-O)/16S rRNA (cytidine1409-2'-O)-methyltransferase